MRPWYLDIDVSDKLWEKERQLGTCGHKGKVGISSRESECNTHLGSSKDSPRGDRCTAFHQDISGIDRFLHLSRNKLDKELE